MPINLVNRGEELANLGKFKQAIESYKEAQKLNPKITIDGSNWATICKMDNIWEYAADVLPACDQLVALDPKTPLPRFYRGLARAIINNINDAIDDFEQSIELISIEFQKVEPSTETDKWQLLSLSLQQRSLINSLRQGRNTVVANAFLVKGAKLAQKGEIEKAIAAYQEAEKSDPKLQIPAEAWNTLCWHGSLHDRAAKVINICEKAVALEPENPEIKDSRGLARSLTGNNKGAIEDFQVYVNWIDKNISNGSESQEQEVVNKLELQKRQRQYWIKILRANKNPFTPEEIKILLNENSTNEF
jgi:tetratricopeptide (TPR) repeat protein